MTASNTWTFILGWAIGVLTPLLIEFLRRRLFDRPKLRISTDILEGDLEDLNAPPSLFVSAVNMTEIPIILNAAFYTIHYGKQAVGIIENGLPEVSEQYEFPLKLARNEQYKQGIQLVPWIQDFLDSRRTLYDDDSPLVYSKVEYHVSFIDTTGHHWESRRIKLKEQDISLVRAMLENSRAFDNSEYDKQKSK